MYVPSEGVDPINIFQMNKHHHHYDDDGDGDDNVDEDKNNNANDVPIRLSYHDGNHYNAVIDPLVPTAGLGLGLPGLMPPGLADKMQLEQAKDASDESAMEEKVRLALVKSAEEEEKERMRVAMEDCEEMEMKEALRESARAMDDVSLFVYYNNIMFVVFNHVVLSCF